jgi:hypothetical protein
MRRRITNTIDRLVASVLGGELVTPLTGLFSNTPRMLVGAVHYGFPIAWLFQIIVAPEYNPWRIDFLKFLADVVTWSVILLVVVFILDKAGKLGSK